MVVGSSVSLSLSTYRMIPRELCDVPGILWSRGVGHLLQSSSVRRARVRRSWSPAQAMYLWKRPRSRLRVNSPSEHRVTSRKGVRAVQSVRAGRDGQRAAPSADETSGFTPGGGPCPARGGPGRDRRAVRVSTAFPAGPEGCSLLARGGRGHAGNTGGRPAASAASAKTSEGPMAPPRGGEPTGEGDGPAVTPGAAGDTSRAAEGDGPETGVRLVARHRGVCADVDSLPVGAPLGPCPPPARPRARSTPLPPLCSPACVFHAPEANDLFSHESPASCRQET